MQPHTFIKMEFPQDTVIEMDVPQDAVIIEIEDDGEPEVSS